MTRHDGTRHDGTRHDGTRHDETPHDETPYEKPAEDVPLTGDPPDDAPVAGPRPVEAPTEPAPEDRPPAAGPLANAGAAVVVVAVGIAGLLGSWVLGLGSPRSPAPGMWPFVVSAAMVVLGVVLGFGTRRTTDAERFSRSSWAVLAGLATMLAYVALIGVIGFEIPSALLAVVWLRFLGGEGWRTSIVTGLAIVVAFYVIFVGALAVPIPHMF